MIQGFRTTASIVVFFVGIAQLMARQAPTPIGKLPDASGTDPLSKARSYAERNLLPAAETELREYLSSHADSAKAHFFLGYVLFRETKARESLAEYTAGAKYQNPSAAEFRVIGADYVLLNDFGDADKWFTRATELEPNNVLGWYYLGRTKYNENRFEEALTAFRTCLKLAPNHVRAQDNLALTLQGLGRYDEAEQAFAKAIEWQAQAPEQDPWPFIDMGSLQLENNHPEKAIPYLQKAIAMVPNSPKAHQQLGKAYLALRDFAKAQSELESAVQLAPDSAPAHYILGQLYQKQGQSEKAKQEFSLYTKLNSSHAKTDRSDEGVAAPN